MPGADRWYVNHDGQVLGPFDLAEFTHAVSRGDVRATDHVCATDTREWVPAGAVPALADLFAPRGRLTGKRPPRRVVVLGSILGAMVLGISALSAVLPESRVSEAPTVASAPAAGSPTRPASRSADATPTDRGFDHFVGEHFRLGSFAYTIKNALFRRSVGTSLVREQASEGATFVVVEYDETNEGRETATGLAGSMRLRDATGRAFQSSSRAMTALAMSGSADALLSELQPGITQHSRVAFEVPTDAATGNLVLLVPERGLLGTGEKRVLLRTRMQYLVKSAFSEIGPPFAKAIRAREYEGLRAVVHPSDRAAFTDAVLAHLADQYDAAVAAPGDFALHYAASRAEGDRVTIVLALQPPTGEWRPRHGKVTIEAREVEGRYWLASAGVELPASR